MQVTLIFPPYWIPSQHFLSLSSLQGFLKKEGVENVTIRDLSIEIMDALLSAERVKGKLTQRLSTDSITVQKHLDMHKMRI